MIVNTDLFNPNQFFHTIHTKQNAKASLSSLHADEAGELEAPQRPLRVLEPRRLIVRVPDFTVTTFSMHHVALGISGP